MMSETLKARLQAVTRELDVLGSKVDSLLTFTPVPYKRIPLLTSVAAKFVWGDMTYREVTWVNGGEDFFVCGLSYAVGFSIFDPTVSEYYPGQADELVADNGQVIGDPQGFDFMWNYRVMSSASNFGSVANSTTFLPRSLLGNRDRAMPLEFDAPLRLVGGDAMTFVIKPVYYAPGGFLPATGRVFVEMMPYGYRTGVMAASAFDREVEG